MRGLCGWPLFMLVLLGIVLAINIFLAGVGYCS